MSACIDLGGGCVDQWAIAVEDPQGAILIEGHARLNLPQRIFGHEKRSFHRAVMSPEPHGPPCGIVAAAAIWKPQGHGIKLYPFGAARCQATSRSEALLDGRPAGMMHFDIILTYSPDCASKPKA
jgi:hypothetical protein